MTREQKAWFEYGRALAGYKTIRTLFPAPSINRLWKDSAEARTIIQHVWDARRSAHAWIPTHRRTCANCALCCRDDDFPRGWYCEELDESASDKFDPDELNCCLWRPKEGGAQ